MTTRNLVAFIFALAAAASITASSLDQWPAAKAPACPQTAGFVEIPNAAVPAEPTRVYRALFDATRPAESPTAPVPALVMLGHQLNALVASGVPLENTKSAVIFHGAAVDGILSDAHYRTKFGVGNPNLEIIQGLKKAGVEIFVCGQMLAIEQIAPESLSPDVTIASTSLIVLTAYQNDGYALLPY